MVYRHTMKSRRINYIGLCAVSILCLLLILASHRYTYNSYVSTDYYQQLPAASANHLLLADHQRQLNPKHSTLRFLRRGGGGGGDNDGPSASFTASGADSSSAFNQTIAIADIITMQRQRIADEMEDFEFADPTVHLTTLTPSTGGHPLRSVIITTWRSGSTFLGDILNALPANFYHYEPLLNYDIVQIRGEPKATAAVRNLRQLLTCNYTAMDAYLEYGQTHNFLFNHNTRLWQYCRLYPQLCWTPSFLRAFCQLFPLQSMKVVRLRLALTQPILDDPQLANVRLVLLIRDPRGTLQSRKHRDWCPGQPDCDDPRALCADMEADYYAARTMLRDYPDRVKVVRYEDLSLDPYAMTQSILAFYGLPFDAAVEEFLDSHTRSDIGGVSSTFRDSKSAPFHWINDLSYHEIERIQASCAVAMRLWGYRRADRATFRRRSFFPLGNYSMELVS